MPSAGSSAAAGEAALAQLRAVAGLDVNTGLAALSGNAVKYLELLARFVESSLEALLALDASDAAAVQALAHGFKGTAATLGLVQISASAAKLEQQLRKSTEPPAQSQVHSALQAIHGALIELAAALPPPAAPTHASAPALDRAELQDLLGRLAALLERADTTAIALMEQHAGSLASSLGQAGTQLVQMVRNFDFEAARDLLADLRQNSL